MTEEQSQFEPVPASGAGAEIFSVPELFYLTNASTIDEWAALKQRAATSWGSWLEEYARPLVAVLAEERGLDLTTPDVGRDRYALLCDAATVNPEGLPLVGVGLGWEHGRLYSPYTGVRLDVDAADQAGVEEVVKIVRARARARASGAGFDSERTWLAWKYVARSGEWWRDLDGLLAQIQRELTSTLDTFQNLLARAG